MLNLHNSDLYNLYQFHKVEKNLITIICALKNIKLPYGVIEISNNGEIENLIEKPEMSFYTITGMYIVEAEVIEELKEGETIGFTDIISQYYKTGRKVGVYPISANSWMDMGEFDVMEEMRSRIEEN